MTESLAEPERLRLARTPTPLEPLERTSAELGVDLWIKRDDLTGSTLTGNKVRKLEFLLADARASGADTVITGGGAQSNHCRATAIAAAQLGLGCRLLLRVPDPASPPATTGNIVLDRLAGADIQWISPALWANRRQAFEAHAAELKDAGKKPYIIVEGGSSDVGCWGYVRGGQELAADLDLLPRRQTTVLYACGSGGTGAGLVLAKAMGLLDAQVVGINVCDDRQYFLKTIGRLCAEFRQRYGGPEVAEADIDIVDGYVGRGYAQSQPEELVNLVALARRDGIILDPVYTGKAWHGMLAELAKDKARFGERVVFLHTGGVFGTLATAEALVPLL